MNDDEDLFGKRPTPPPRQVDPKASEMGRHMANLRWGRGGGAQARDDAIESVAEAEKELWRKKHDEELLRFVKENDEFIAEDFRHWFCLTRGHEQPHKPQVWGAMWMTAVRRMWIEKTGKYAPMQQRSSHGRESAVYRRGPALVANMGEKK